MAYAKTLTSKIGNLVARRYIRFFSCLRKGDLAADGWRPLINHWPAILQRGGISSPVDPGGGQPVLITLYMDYWVILAKCPRGGTTVATPHPKGFFLAFFLGSPCGLAANTPTSQTTAGGKTKPPNESPIKKYGRRANERLFATQGKFGQSVYQIRQI